LSHLEACSNLIPINPPPLNLNNTVKLMAQNMLRLNIDPIKIIEDNIMFIVKNLNGKVINNHNNERYLLSNQDIINIRNSVTKDMWNIDIRRPVEINIHQFFGKDAVDNEIKTSTIFYKPCLEQNDRIKLVLATTEQRKSAWRYGHKKMIHLDGTFGISNKKILLFVLLVVNDDNKGIPVGYLLFSAANGAQRSSSSYNHLILKELLLHYKSKLSEEFGEEFIPKVKH
jgi:hypothetical protein